MSRIHEALKKAAQERAQQTARIESSAIDTVELPSPAAPTSLADVFRAEPYLPTEPLLQPHEELLKKCRTCSFRVDPRMSVFEGQDEANLGAERFRTLRSRLYQISSVRPLKKVLITSTVPAEGKTFVAANLAQSIVRQPERKVLLIDADLRASRLHLCFHGQSTPGLTDYLCGDVDAFSVVQRGEGSNLFMIPGGKDVVNPSELLLNERMKFLLDTMTPLFDWIILDTPPALPVHDASIVADLCDGVLLVVRAESTDYEMVMKASSEFQEKNLLGVVLNRVERGVGYGGYYYGYPDARDHVK